MSSDILLRVVETAASTWHYHLRRVGERLPVCGYDRMQVMMTEIPVVSWGAKSHLNERWCEKCGKILEETKQ